MDTHRCLKAESDLQNKFMVPRAEEYYMAERAQEEWHYDMPQNAKSPFYKD